MRERTNTQRQYAGFKVSKLERCPALVNSLFHKNQCIFNGQNCERKNYKECELYDKYIPRERK